MKPDDAYVFRDLPDPTRREIVEAAIFRTYPKGKVLCRRGDRATDLIVVVTGAVDAWLRTSSHQRIHVARLGPAASVGWTLLTGGRHAAEVVAATTVEAVLIPGRLVERLFDREPALRVAVFAEQQRTMDELCLEIAATRLPLAMRILAKLWRLALGARRIQITQAELAEILGARRSSIARALGDLDADGYTDHGRGWITLL